jgi:hypothetical protein
MLSPVFQRRLPESMLLPESDPTRKFSVSDIVVDC